MHTLPFSGAFVLNMAHAVQRRARIKLILERNRIPFEFMPGERSRHPDNQMASILGCLWTHAKCVRAAKDMSWVTVLIIEDDAVIHPRFYDLLPDLDALNCLQWDVFYFYHASDDGPSPRIVHPVAIVPVEYSIWSHFYVVHHRFYDTFLMKACSSNWYSDRLFRGHPYRLYGLTANLVGQDAGKSDITGAYNPNIRGLSF